MHQLHPAAAASLPAPPPAAPPSVARTQRSRRWLGQLQVWLALLVAVLVLLAALFAPWVAPYEPAAVSLGKSFRPPGPGHWLGTDGLGRDILSRIIHGARVSLAVAGSAVLISGLLGAFLGILGGYCGRAVDAVVMRLADIQLAFPAVILAMVLSGAIGVSLGTLVLVLVLANWARFARVIRGEVLSLKARDFVLLARLAGASRLRIMARHIAPNVVGTFIVLATLDIGSVIVLEASLSFLGLGIQPPTPSWGSMIAEGRGYLNTSWWICVVPGVVLIGTVLAANLLGDALRDRLNPVIPESW